MGTGSASAKDPAKALPGNERLLCLGAGAWRGWDDP
jgi:hypothetical protein